MRPIDERQLRFLSGMVHRLIPVLNVRLREWDGGTGGETYTLVIYDLNDGC